MIERERFDQAELALLEAHQVFTAALGTEHTYTIQAVSRLSELYQSRGQQDQAAKYSAMLSGG